MIETIPPYSPDLNPSENMWEEIREKFFCNAVFKSLKGVEDKLVESALFYENNQQIVESIIQSQPVIDSMDKAQKVIYLLHLGIIFSKTRKYINMTYLDMLNLSFKNHII